MEKMMPETWIPVESTNLAAICFIPEEGTASGELRVRFHAGKVFSYEKVPSHVVENLITAASLGSYFHRYIRGKFPYRELSAAVREA